VSTDPVAILADLVGIPSPSAVSNRPVIEYAVRFLRSRGWETTILPYFDGRGVEKLNLVAVTPAGSGTPMRAELALVGHTDTVPWDATWHEATTMNVRDGRLFGRGACDMKGFIAAAFAAISDLRMETLSKPLAVVLTADEEVGCVGAKQLCSLQTIKPRYAIVGEPTSLRPVRAGKGYCLAEIIVEGKEAHSAFPGLGISAIQVAAQLIGRIEEIASQLAWMSNPLFDPPHTTLNIGTIAGGRAKNIVAGECRFLLEWRPISDDDSRTVISLLDEAIACVQRAYPDAKIKIDHQRSDAGFATAAKSSLVQRLEELSGSPAQSVAFGTEAPQIAQLGAEVVVFGPGNMRDAHRTNEFLAKDELVRTVPILRKLIADLCGHGPLATQGDP
jgi:acetylornithine deacetylase